MSLERIAPTTAEEERQLVSGLLAGTTGAIREFVDRTHGPVFRMAARYTSDPDLREEWTHEVLLRVLEELGRGRFRLQRPGGLWSWFSQRAHYLLLDQVTRRARDQARHVDEAAFVDEIAATGIHADPARAIEAVEARRVLEKCLEGIANGDHRRALEMQMLDESTYEEVAERLDAPLNTVRSWIRRARVQVRRCVATVYGLELDAGS